MPGASHFLAMEKPLAELRSPGMATFVSDVLREHDVEPHRLAIEISETGMMTDDLLGLDALTTLKELGLGIEIDDFGTGYSSISYLRQLPIDTVKVNQSLIRNLGTNTRQVAFVAAILRLIESAGLRAVVEGIETAGQLARLLEIGCHYGQGYYFSPPVAREQMTQLLTYQHITAPALKGRVGSDPAGTALEKGPSPALLCPAGATGGVTSSDAPRRT